MQYDAIVVGAGYAGLAAGLALQKAGKNILVVEARNRCGGRILTEYFSEQDYTDLGGQWIGPGHERMYQLAAEFGVETFHTYDSGKSTLLFHNKLKHYKGLIPPLPLFALLSLDRALSKINKLAKTIDLAHPYQSLHAAKWDAMSLQDWMNMQMKNETARKMFAVATEAVFATDASNISFLHALFYIKSNTNFDFLMNVDKGAQQDRIKGGAQSICIKMAAALGDSIQYEKVVTHIHQDEQGVMVSGDGFSFKADQCIVAIPPAVSTEINYTPAVPETQWQLMRASFMGTVVKCYAVYPSPFWRKQFKNGLVAAPDELTSLVFDNSPFNGSKGILMGFSLAEKAKQLMQHDQATRKEIVKAGFIKMFGPEAANIEYYTDKSFTEESFTKGCYAGMFPPGILTQLQTSLTTPFHRIHWAGTETSIQFNGYMEGAVRSGERAAREII
ncbi:FAD-dependent oxidoreductase [Sediminibacterium sp.]|uniref:flavin monoamine oxidase family protein n=1 Tax=Sediminibacterium sp. TaxID=1917865 RepID=UPI002733419D|nr:FAD-dependent oxidoreductase [Sediminibacterium sp.]MDP3392329.1 FAD-dependent oxidoreductase [Sediminibacterium sp.]MDP3566869.1 FAD-dependent oxidoreductase [Sediminibacterium sp.]